MKSLQESLFDSDIVEKGIYFGDYYELEHFGFQNNMYNTDKTPYNSMFSHLKLADLKKNYKPADISNVQYGTVWSRVDYDEIKTYVRPLQYIVSLINRIEIPSLGTFSRTSEFINELISKLLDKINPYLKDRKILFTASYSYGSIIISMIERGAPGRRMDDYTMNLTFVKK